MKKSELRAIIREEVKMLLGKDRVKDVLKTNEKDAKDNEKRIKDKGVEADEVENQVPGTLKQKDVEKGRTKDLGV